MENNDQNRETQEANSFLRERFLYLISNLSGTECCVKMYENTTVTGNVKAFDANFENVVMENLQTPLPQPLRKAILRTNDIISMEFNYDINKILNK